MFVASANQFVALPYDSPGFHHVLSNLFLLPLIKSGTERIDFQSVCVLKGGSVFWSSFSELMFIS